MSPQLLVNIDVDDLDRGIAFYCGAFDFTVGRRLGDGAVELLGAPCPLYLLVKAQGTRAAATTGQTRDYTRHWTPVHLDLVVADIDASLARAEAAGARREGDVRTEVWGRIVQLADPFGHGLCLIEFRGRGYDEIADPGA